MTDPKSSDGAEVILLPSMRQRAEGLRIARESLRTGGPFASSVGSFEVTDLIDVAAYVVEGTHPLDRHAGTGGEA